MNNNKQSNRTHVDFFEYIEMSCVDNIIRSDKITSIPPSMISIILWSHHIGRHMDEDTLSTHNTQIKHSTLYRPSGHTLLHFGLGTDPLIRRGEKISKIRKIR